MDGMMRVYMLRGTVIRRMGSTVAEAAEPGQVVDVEDELGRWLCQVGKARLAPEESAAPVERAVMVPGEKRGERKRK